MIELLVAAVILLFGVAMVVQLVPRAMQANLASKQDSTSVVIAERLLDQMLSQPVGSAAFNNAEGIACSLGSPALAGFVGHPVMLAQNRVQINFGVQAITPGYGYNWRDPNDASGANYEVRWAVLTSSAGGAPVHKRFVVGVWKRGLGGQNALPVTLEAAVGR
jgi:hypothetical protein